MRTCGHWGQIWQRLWSDQGTARRQSRGGPAGHWLVHHVISHLDSEISHIVRESIFTDNIAIFVLVAFIFLPINVVVVVIAKLVVVFIVFVVFAILPFRVILLVIFVVFIVRSVILIPLAVDLTVLLNKERFGHFVAAGFALRVFSQHLINIDPFNVFHVNLGALNVTLIERFTVFVFALVIFGHFGIALVAFARFGSRCRHRFLVSSNGRFPHATHEGVQRRIETLHLKRRVPPTQHFRLRSSLQPQRQDGDKFFNQRDLHIHIVQKQENESTVRIGSQHVGVRDRSLGRSCGIRL